MVLSGRPLCSVFAPATARHPRAAPRRPILLHNALKYAFDVHCYAIERICTAQRLCICEVPLHACTCGYDAKFEISANARCNDRLHGVAL